MVIGFLIGKELALQYSSLGANVIITSRTEESLISVKNECADSDKVRYFVLDMEHPYEVEKWCNDHLSEIGPIDVLVHNAGLSMREMLMDTCEISFGYFFNSIIII
jgi:dehydrogenase/reductase SDR family protein 7B